MNVLGKENVLVINSDDLDVKNMGKVRSVISDTFKFLGLCPFHLPYVISGLYLLPLILDLSYFDFNNKYISSIYYCMKLTVVINESQKKVLITESISDVLIGVLKTNYETVKNIIEEN
jgi:competence transcription factor ComK